MHNLCVISLLIASATAFSNNINHLLLNLDITPQQLSEVEEKWIEQPLDHFDPNEKRTFKTRYFENLELWKENSPIYIFIGGESELDSDWAANSPSLLMAQIAMETNGALFALEHRYYGQSMPEKTDDNFIKYCKFLSSQQALADLANLIKTLKSNPKYKSSKVVVIGGSYPGNLAVWMRELYPDLVDAAVAASAPVLAKKDFHEYLDTVRYVFDKYGTKNCLARIEKQFKHLEELLKTPEGREQIKDDLKICADTDMSVLENQQYLFTTYYDALKRVVQYADSPDSIKDKCRDQFDLTSHLLPQELGLKLDIGKGEGLGYDCMNLTFAYIQAELPHSVIGHWMYQACNEFGYQQTTSSNKQPFDHWNPPEFLVKTCKYFVEGDAEKEMDKGIEMTNKMYGGLTPKVTKVVFTHGDMDPWHGIGVLHDLGPEAPSTMVNGTSHCGILAERPGEPDEMTENRKYVKDLIKKWIA